MSALLSIFLWASPAALAGENGHVAITGSDAKARVERSEKAQPAKGAWPLRLATVDTPPEAARAVPLLPDDVGLRGTQSDLFATLQSAYQTDLRLQAATLDIEAADRGVWRELARFAPVVTSTVRYQLDEFSDPTTRLQRTDDESVFSVTASLPLFSGGSRYFGLKAARNLKRASQFDAASARDDVAFDVVETWVLAVTSQREAELVGATISGLQTLRSAVMAQRKSGFADASDVARIDADIASAKRLRAQIVATTQKARDRLKTLGGELPPSTAHLPALSDVVGNSKSDLLEAAKRFNPKLMAANAVYHARNFEHRSAMGRHLPQVTLDGEYRKYLDDTNRLDDESVNVGIRLRIPIFEAATLADISAGGVERDAALVREAAVFADLQRQIDDLWADRGAVRSMRDQMEAELAARRTAAEAARKRFSSGFGSLDDAIRAEAERLSAEREALQLASSAVLVDTRLLIAAGRFSPDLL